MTIAAPPEPTSTQDIYNEALTLGGSVLQAQVAASLAGGIESGIGGGYGAPQSEELAGGIGPAEGLFQFEPGTWTGGAGGGKGGLPATVGAATWEQQIEGFINDTGGPGGSDFGAWGPDLGASYGYAGPPLPGSPVASAIATNAKAWAANTATGAEGLSALGTGTNASLASNAQLASVNANPFDLFGIPQTFIGGAASAVWADVGPFLAKSFLVLAGLALGILGLYKAADVGQKVKAGAQQAAPLALAAAA
jgi:hypothetical protein